MLISVANPPALDVNELHSALHSLFNDSAEHLAKQTGFTQRVRKLSGPVFAKTLVFCLLKNPQSTLDDFADFALKNLKVDAKPQSFDGRFNEQAALFLQTLFAESFALCFSARPAVLPLLRRFNGVFVRDASSVRLPTCLADVLPGRKGRGKDPAAALKLVLEMEVTTGQLTEACELPGLDNEKTSEVSSKPLPAGSLLLEDMGFFCGERMQVYVDQGVVVLTRIPAWTAVFDEKSKKRLNLVKLLRQAGGGRLELRVRILHKEKLSLRLLAVRVPEEQAQKRRQRVLEEAKKRGRPVSQKKLDLCEWNILLTNATAEQISLSEASELRRVRWQVEVLFKAFKSEGGIEKTRSENPWRVLSELYAKLLAMMVRQWLLLGAGYVMLVHSVLRAARRVRDMAAGVVKALGSVEQLAEELAALAVMLRSRCRVQHRHKNPSTFDRLVALDHHWIVLHLAA
jgi:Transposase DDE domain